MGAVACSVCRLRRLAGRHGALEGALLSAPTLAHPTKHPPAAGHTPDVVKRAKQEIKRILEESTEKAMRREAPAAGRYSVM